MDNPEKLAGNTGHEDTGRRKIKHEGKREKWKDELYGPHQTPGVLQKL